MNWETLLCLGDSITIGSRSYLGYPEYCGSLLSEKTSKNWNVINHAVAGFTTIDLVRSIDKSIANLKTVKPEFITILIGTNDLKSKTSSENFKLAFNQLLTKAQLIIGNKNILVLEIPELLDGVMLPYKTEMNKTVLEYNNIIKEIVEKEGVMHMNMHTEPSQFYDGVHLNDFGSKEWAKKICNYILNLRTL
jgi:lysophospholipase L1-like esterase